VLPHVFAGLCRVPGKAKLRHRLHCSYSMGTRKEAPWLVRGACPRGLTGIGGLRTIPAS